MGMMKASRPEYDCLTAVLLEVGHVHFQSGEEHDVVEAHFAEELEAAVARQDVEPVFADHQSRQYHADDVRDAEPVQQDGGEQDDEQYKEKYPCRVGYRQFQAKIKQVHRFEFWVLHCKITKNFSFCALSYSKLL